MKFIYKRNSSSQTGFSLVEVMVGLAIGMVVGLVIMQVYSVFEGQKRTTTGTADAQTNGSIALYNIGRELQVAGYPLMPSGLPAVADSALECTDLKVNGAATSIANLAPVAITDGVATASVSASDTITIHYGNSTSGGIPTTITGAPVGLAAPVENNFGCQVGNITLITKNTNCYLSSATAVTGTTSVTLTNTTGVTGDANLACLGTWDTVTYAVNNGNLERNGVPVVAGVVNLQAQYGVSTTTNSNQVNQWVNAIGGTWAAPTVANRNLIKSIRIAVITRNPKIEPLAVTTACSSTSAASPTGLCAWEGVAVAGSITTASPAPTVDLSPSDANWARYRYRVFETIIPLRNMVWSRETL